MLKNTELSNNKTYTLSFDFDMFSDTSYEEVHSAVTNALEDINIVDYDLRSYKDVCHLTWQFHLKLTGEDIFAIKLSGSFDFITNIKIQSYGNNEIWQQEN